MEGVDNMPQVKIIDKSRADGEPFHIFKHPSPKRVQVFFDIVCAIFDENKYIILLETNPEL
jgi:hypothetical protein